MSSVAIKVCGLGKRYDVRRTTAHARFETLRDAFVGALARRPGSSVSALWALRNISFEISQGEVVGLIGHNGAGKSTLLKVLSRITEPTEGHAEIDGRVGSLLEVGTGFHPELTGRENVFLNGAILGMRRSDIELKFDEIIAFAETEAFLDTPVKKYSSGMYLRLAFAVAAHLEPDILIVDEILAVGDVAFQRKCLGKMDDVARQGRTVLFVSHNMGAVKALCSRALVFSAGQVDFQGPTDEAIAHYLRSSSGGTAHDEGRTTFETTGSDGQEVVLREVRLVGSDGRVRGIFDASDPIRVEIDYDVRVRLRGARTTLQLSTEEGEQAFLSTDHVRRAPEQFPGSYRSICLIPGGLLNRRRYSISIDFDQPGVRALVSRHAKVSFLVSGGGNHGSIFPERWPGVVCPLLEWATERLPGLNPKSQSAP